jgi:hypothetical protein
MMQAILVTRIRVLTQDCCTITVYLATVTYFQRSDLLLQKSAATFHAGEGTTLLLEYLTNVHG